MTRGAHGYRIVDLDDRRTWPRSFGRFIFDLSQVSDFEDSFLPDEVERAAVDLLRGCLIRVYHCTRLTQREIANVRENGLRPLSLDFTETRIANAREDGEITQEQEEFFRKVHVASDSNRQGLIFLFTDRAGLSNAPSIGWLLSAWGGEGINMGVETKSPEFRVFESIGIPTVVVATVDLDLHASRIHPGLALAALRKLHGSTQGTSIVSEVTISGEYIERLELPGSKFWELYVWTPRAGYK